MLNVSIVNWHIEHKNKIFILQWYISGMAIINCWFKLQWSLFSMVMYMQSTSQKPLQGVKVHRMWTTHSEDSSYPGNLVPRAIHLIPKTIRTQDNSSPGQFITHASPIMSQGMNEWCATVIWIMRCILFWKVLKYLGTDIWQLINRKKICLVVIILIFFLSPWYSKMQCGDLSVHFLHLVGNKKYRLINNVFFKYSLICLRHVRSVAQQTISTSYNWIHLIQTPGPRWGEIMFSAYEFSLIRVYKSCLVLGMSFPKSWACRAAYFKILMCASPCLQVGMIMELLSVAQ